MSSNETIVKIVVVILLAFVILYLLSRQKKIRSVETEEFDSSTTVVPNVVQSCTCSLTDTLVPFDFGSAPLSYVQALGVQSTGKIVAASDVYLWRFNLDGSLDTTFGTAGIVTIPSYTYNAINVIRITQDDKIYIGTGGFNVNVMRYTVDGVLDTSFAGTGHFIGGPLIPTSAGVIDIWVGSDNSVLASRFADYTIYKITAAGIYDPSFTNIITTVPGYTVSRIPEVIAYQDKIYTFGYIRDLSFNFRPFISRSNSDGTPDNSFGTNGVYIIQPADLGLTDMAVESYGGSTIDFDTGDLYWVGSIDLTLTENFYYNTVIKLSNAGVIDSTYGTNGLVQNTFTEYSSFTYNYAETYDNAVIDRCDGSLIIAGNNYGDTDSRYIWKISAQGVTSSYFLDIDSVLNFYFNGIKPDSNGNLIVAGFGAPALKVLACTDMDYREQDLLG